MRMRIIIFENDYHNSNYRENNMKISRRIEKGIYNYCIDYSIKNNIYRSWENKLFHRVYMSKVISIYSNIDEKSYIGNKNLLKRILNDEIDPTKLAKMSSYDTYPEKWGELLDKKTKRDKFEREYNDLLFLFSTREIIF